MEAYVNGMTGKKGFALVKNEKRIWGCVQKTHLSAFSNLDRAELN